MLELFATLLLAGLVVLFILNRTLASRVALLERRVGAGFVPHQRPLIQPDPAGEAPAAASVEPAQAPPPSPVAVQAPSFARTFESLIGGSLLIWVGGVALVVAAVFLIRYSIEIGLVTPQLRMVAAAIFGAALVAGGEWARSSKRLSDDPRISQALVGAGLAILYLTVYGSYILYNFLGLGAASALMLAVTVAALALSLRHGVGCAAMGMVGGYLTPLLIDDGAANALTLLAYLTLLDIGVFFIAWRRGWGWLAGAAVLASFAWALVLAFGSVPDAIAAGWFALLLGIAAGFIKPAGASLTWLQPAAIAAVLIAVLVARADVGAIAWVQFGAIAVAALVQARVLNQPPWVPLVILIIGLQLLSIEWAMGDQAWLPTAAAGLTLLFGVGGLALTLERRTALWAVLACNGFAGPAVTMRVISPDLLSHGGWGLLFILLACGPAILVLTRRARHEPGSVTDLFSLAPPLTAAFLLTLAAYDLVAWDLLSIAWLALAIVFIAVGMAAAERSLRVAGLVLLTVTVFKIFLIDAAELDGILRILSFFGLGASLIVLGRFYGILLRSERATA